MHITDFITPERIACCVQVASKKRALEVLSRLIASSSPDLLETEIFDSLVARERLGSTGIGHGAAIPHGRLASVGEGVGALVRLAQPVDFDAVDNEPVDLLVALVVPAESTEEHLQILAALAGMLRDTDFCERLRQTDSAEAIYRLLSGWEDARAPQHVAAPHG